MISNSLRAWAKSKNWGLECSPAAHQEQPGVGVRRAYVVHKLTVPQQRLLAEPLRVHTHALTWRHGRLVAKPRAVQDLLLKVQLFLGEFLRVGQGRDTEQDTQHAARQLLLLLL